MLSLDQLPLSEDLNDEAVRTKFADNARKVCGTPTPHTKSIEMPEARPNCPFENRRLIDLAYDVEIATRDVHVQRDRPDENRIEFPESGKDIDGLEGSMSLALPLAALE